MRAEPSIRSSIIEARTYLRPLDDQGTVFETPEQATERVIGHQRWLWERAKAGALRRDLKPTRTGYEVVYDYVPLTADEEAELAELKELMLDRKVALSGRTRWLGGTAVTKKIEATNFNCSFLEVRTVHDVVDAYWLLLQGCGVGFRPVVGNLNGFSRPMNVKIIRSTRGPYEKGRESNVETFVDGVWTLSIGDSSAAWAKSLGKLLAGKNNAHTLVIDFTQVRGKGARLSSYGWVSSGDEQIAPAYEAIAQILNNRAGQLLSRLDILDVVNWCGYTLSSRRAAEIALVAFGEPEWAEFAVAKKDHWTNGNIQRSQSNNSLMFYSRPTKYQLRNVFKLMTESGGSEPGFINAEQALRRAPYFRGINPCAEILLGDRSFCNLVETVLPRFNNEPIAVLMRAHYLAARANYRQTCVDLRDGVLQDGWHQSNEFLRLCGVGVTGAVAWEHVDENQAWEDLRAVAQLGANEMADQLGLPRAKNVTTIKPSGTQSKCAGIVGMEIPEGLHKPIGRYIFNNVRFSATDKLVDKLRAAHYNVFQDPYNPTDVLVTLPVEFSHVVFDKLTVHGEEVEVNLEPALVQLARYQRVMRHYVDHNASVTIYYSPEEIPDIVDWLMENWNDYVGVSFIYRTDPSKTAADLGYPYMPQEVVSARVYNEYVSQLLPVNLTDVAAADMLDTGECTGGACPIR